MAGCSQKQSSNMEHMNTWGLLHRALVSGANMSRGCNQVRVGMHSVALT